MMASEFGSDTLEVIRTELLAQVSVGSAFVPVWDQF
jgi:hypothetical protein